MVQFMNVIATILQSVIHISSKTQVLISGIISCIFRIKYAKFMHKGQTVLSVHKFQHLTHSTVVSCSDNGYQKTRLMGGDVVMW
jgi:hypothetical protein